MLEKGHARPQIKTLEQVTSEYLARLTLHSKALIELAPGLQSAASMAGVPSSPLNKQGEWEREFVKDEEFEEVVIDGGKGEGVNAKEGSVGVAEKEKQTWKEWWRKK